MRLLLDEQRANGVDFRDVARASHVTGADGRRAACERGE